MMSRSVQPIRIDSLGMMTMFEENIQASSESAYFQLLFHITVRAHTGYEQDDELDSSF